MKHRYALRVSTDNGDIYSEVLEGVETDYDAIQKARLYAFQHPDNAIRLTIWTETSGFQWLHQNGERNDTRCLY